MTLFAGLQQVVDIEGRLAEEFVAALGTEGDKAALNGADAGGGDVAVLDLVGFRFRADVLEHGLQVF